MSRQLGNKQPTGANAHFYRGRRRAEGRRALFSAVTLLAGIAGCGAVVSDELLGTARLGPVATTESHKDFQTFEYTCTPGLGFDADADMLSHVTITRNPAGAYWLDASAWAASAADSRITWDDVGLDSTWDPNDASVGWSYYLWTRQEPVERSLASRALTADEVEQMLSVFAVIPVEYEQIDSMIDYYFLEDVRWDRRSLSANPNFGYSETISYAKVEEIVRMLDDFAAASRQ